MYKLNKDFEFLSSIIGSFFKQKHIIKRLNEIDENYISGWEIWLQVEMLLYFRKLDQISEVYREKPCVMDRRKTYKTKCAIDLVIRQKRARSSIPLEIKQSKSVIHCINQMLRDIEKYGCIKSRYLPTERAIWCMGIHKAPRNKKHIDNKLSEYYPKIVCEPIKGTDYMYTLF